MRLQQPSHHFNQRDQAFHSTDTTTAAMSERTSSNSHDQKPSSNNNHPCCLTTISESLKIFPRNKHTLFSIFALLTLPFSFLVFSLSLSSHPIKSQILHLEAVATLSSTRFEARHIWKESRDNALSLVHLKLIYFLPSYLLSLLAAITTVISADSAYHRNPISLRAALAAVKPTWTRPLVTSICVYAVLLLYSTVPHTLTAIIGGASPGSRLAIWVVGSGVELYIMAVLGMGLAVSVLERRFGLDAIRVGSNLMEGRRLCGWFLSGLLALITGGIGWVMDGLMMDGEDLLQKSKWTALMVVMKRWERVGLIGVYGVVVVWGYIVTTVFYCECRKRHVGREEEEGVDTS